MKYQALVILLAELGICSSGSAVTMHEISTSSDCKKAPTELVKSCNENKGSKEPFTYASISKVQGCISISDTIYASECKSSINSGKYYNIEKSKIDYSTDEASENSAMNTIASSTKALAIIAGINLGITIAGITLLLLAK